MPTSIGSNGVHHVSINVHDVDEARRFYVEVLGFSERADRPEFPFAGAWLDVGDGQQLHLIEVEGFEPPAGQHFAVAVADLDEAIAAVARHGVAASEPSTIDGICRQAFITDPTGNVIEFNQSLVAG